MDYKLPTHVIKQYGSSRAFRARKREIVREMRRLASELTRGAAYFPNGYAGVDRIEYGLKILANELSVKNWGR